MMKEMGRQGSAVEVSKRVGGLRIVPTSEIGPTPQLNRNSLTNEPRLAVIENPPTIDTATKPQPNDIQTDNPCAKNMPISGHAVLSHVEAAWPSPGRPTANPGIRRPRKCSLKMEGIPWSRRDLFRTECRNKPLPPSLREKGAAESPHGIVLWYGRISPCLCRRRLAPWQCGPPNPPLDSAHFLQFQHFTGAVPEIGGNAEPVFTDNSTKRADSSADNFGKPRKER